VYSPATFEELTETDFLRRNWEERKGTDWKIWTNSLELVIKFDFAGLMTSIENRKFMTLKVQASERRKPWEDEFMSGCHLCVWFQGCGCGCRSWIERDGISIGADPASSHRVDSFRWTHGKMCFWLRVCRWHLLHQFSGSLMWICSNKSEIDRNSVRPGRKHTFQKLPISHVFRGARIHKLMNPDFFKTQHGIHIQSHY
jgi:hypothetical protein